MKMMIRLAMWAVLCATTAIPASALYNWSDLIDAGTVVTATGGSWDTASQWNQVGVYTEFSYYGFDAHSSYGPGYATNSFTVTKDPGCFLYSVYSEHYGELEGGGWWWQGASSDSAQLCGQQGGGGGGGGGGQIPGLGTIYSHVNKDGDGGSTFTVPITGGTPIAYQWSWSVAPYVFYSGPQNNPNPGFTTPQSQSTDAISHWYSVDGDQCTHYHSQYQVTASVDFSDGQHLTGSSFLEIHIDGFKGITNPDEAGVVGYPDVIPVPGVGWFLNGPGSMYRTIPASTYKEVIPNSQFWDKIHEHEGQHVAHFYTGPFEDYQTVNGLYSLVNTQIYLSYPAFISMTDYWRAQYLFLQKNTGALGPPLNQRIHMSENLAYLWSDNFSPHYGGFERACHPNEI